jgi:predicted ATPase/class 3 adenylate cyclase
MPGLPTGTVTFLFTDIEGSTRLWEEHPETMRLALARHDALLQAAINQHDGHLFKTIGDAFCAAFHTAPDALSAALAAQQGLTAEVWPEPISIRVRMALHTGAAEVRDNDYFGQPLNRVARLLSAGHGGQVLLSLPAEELVRDVLPLDADLKALGEHRLRDLNRPESVFQLLHPDLPALFPPLKSLEGYPNNLPRQLTSFIGREREIAEIRTLLTATSLLTLTGSGGCGKTRLALQAAAEALEAYPDGVWLVELAALADPSLVHQEVASALGLREQAGKSLMQTLTDFLKPRRLLLVLDNCEHLLSACAQLSHALLRSYPSLTILATSREGLGMAGEQTYRVPSLSLPDPSRSQTVETLSRYEAVRLFLERAVGSRADFVVTNASAPALASVCHRLDGIPLAIELAAARVRSLSLEELDSRLDNRFRLLTGGSRTSLPRQQTLRALIDWSYDLLSEPEKLLLCRLSVFAGGWRLEAAEEVGAGESELSGVVIEDWEVLEHLTSLVDKSLVAAESEGDRTRYRLLQTVRQYGRERLEKSGESAEVRGRHRDHFLGVVEAADPKLHGPDQSEWLEMLESEHDNLRQSLALCLEEPEGAEAGLRLGAALWRFWKVRGYLSEGRTHLGAVLAREMGQEQRKVRGRALNGAGVLAWGQGDFAVARALHEESLTIFRELGDRQGIANSLFRLGNAADSPDDRTALYVESLTIFRELGDKRGIALSLKNLGLTSSQGDYAAARALHEESLTIFRELGDKRGIASSLCCLGNLASDQGDYAVARPLHEESLTIHRELGAKYGIASSLDAFADMAQKEQQAIRAVRLWEAATALHEVIGARREPADLEKHEEWMAQIREALGEESFLAACAEGRAMTLEQAVALALARE